MPGRQSVNKVVNKFVIVTDFLADACIALSVVTEQANKAVKRNHSRIRISELFLRECIHVVRKQVFTTLGHLVK